MLTVQEAREKRVCRICEQPIQTQGSPKDWPILFGEMTYPLQVTLNFGEEFAHTACLKTMETSVRSNSG